MTRWPEAPAELEHVWRHYFREMGGLAARILALFARALGLAEDYFEPAIDRHASALRALRYPALAVGFHRHGTRPLQNLSPPSLT